MHLPDSDSEDELPPLWEERATMEGSVYYVNHGSKRTQWTHPRTGKKKVVVGDLPLGWDKVVTDDGKILFVDHMKQRTSYSDPRLAFATEEKEGSSDFRQKYDGSTCALQVLHGHDLQGKIAVITGANSGIGWETARSLALHGCHVIFAVRKVTETREAIKSILQERPYAKCTVIALELLSLKSVQSFANTLKETVSHVDMLILNAGIFGVPFRLTDDGYESVFQVNHLSQFYLTLEIEPLLRPGSRVVVVSSESHRFASLTMPLSTSELSPLSKHNYWNMRAYNNSKLCNVLFATELARRWEHRLVAVFSLHPGNIVSSNISRYWWVYRLLFAIVRPFTKSLQQAASTSVYCATSRDLDQSTGLYFNNCWHCEPSTASQDPEMAKDLWNISNNLIAKWKRRLISPSNTSGVGLNSLF